MKKHPYIIFSIFYNEKKDDFLSIIYNVETHKLCITNGDKKYSIHTLSEEINSTLHYVKHQIKKYLELTEMYTWKHEILPINMARVFKTKNGKYFGHYFTIDGKTKKKYNYNKKEYDNIIKEVRENSDYSKQEVFLNLKNDTVAISKKFMEYFLR